MSCICYYNTLHAIAISQCVPVPIIRLPRLCVPRTRLCNCESTNICTKLLPRSQNEHFYEHGRPINSKISTKKVYKYQFIHPKYASSNWRVLYAVVEASHTVEHIASKHPEVQWLDFPHFHSSLSCNCK